MLSVHERQMLRYKTGHNDQSLPDATLDMLWAQAEADYAGQSQRVMRQAVVVELYRNLLAEARKHVNYRMNQQQENLSDIAKGLQADLTRESQLLAQLLVGEKRPALRTVKLSRKALDR